VKTLFKGKSLLKGGRPVLYLLNYAVFDGDKLPEIRSIEAESLNLYRFLILNAFLDLTHEVLHRDAEIGQEIFFSIIWFLFYLFRKFAIFIYRKIGESKKEKRLT
jgi:hypothetical protein